MWPIIQKVWPHPCFIAITLFSYPVKLHLIKEGRQSEWELDDECQRGGEESVNCHADNILGQEPFEDAISASERKEESFSGKKGWIFRESIL
jgi:hypothetical protein